MTGSAASKPTKSKTPASWGEITPRTGHVLEYALVTSAARCAESSPKAMDAVFDVTVAATGEVFALPLRSLLAPYPTLREDLHRHADLARMLSYANGAALAFYNQRLPLAFTRDAQGRPHRPKGLFDAWTAPDGPVRVQPNHRLQWLEDHVGKHMLGANADPWREIVKAAAITTSPSEVVASMRRGVASMSSGDALPLVELYSVLATLSYTSPGAVQADVSWAPGWQVAPSSLFGELAQMGASQATRSEVGVDIVYCATLPGALAVAKGQPGRAASWATLHPRPQDVCREAVARLGQQRALRVASVVK